MSTRDWSVRIRGKHIKDCTDAQLREWLRARGMKSVSVNSLTHCEYWPDGWAILPLRAFGYVVVDNGGKLIMYKNSGAAIEGGSIYALAARVVIVSIVHELTAGTSDGDQHSN